MGAWVTSDNRSIEYAKKTSYCHWVYDRMFDMGESVYWSWIFDGVYYARTK